MLPIIMIYEIDSILILIIVSIMITLTVAIYRSKLAYGLLSGRYSLPENEEDNKGLTTIVSGFIVCDYNRSYSLSISTSHPPSY